MSKTSQDTGGGTLQGAPFSVVLRVLLIAGVLLPLPMDEQDIRGQGKRWGSAQGAGCRIAHNHTDCHIQDR